MAGWSSDTWFYMLSAVLSDCRLDKFISASLSEGFICWFLAWWWNLRTLLRERFLPVVTAYYLPDNIEAFMVVSFVILHIVTL